MPGAQASTVTYSLNLGGCSGGCGADVPFATVTLTDEGSGATAFTLVTETLNTSEVYAASSGEALEFNFNFTGLFTLTSLQITNLTSGFANGAASGSAPPYGSFSDYISCSSCSGGNPGNPAGPLSFDIGSTAGPVTTASFVANSGGDYFASDIRGTNGNTGDVSTNTAGTVSATPEPATFGLIGLSLAGVGLLRRKRKTSQATGC